ISLISPESTAAGSFAFISSNQTRLGWQPEPGLLLAWKRFGGCHLPSKSGRLHEMNISKDWQMNLLQNKQSQPVMILRVFPCIGIMDCDDSAVLQHRKPAFVSQSCSLGRLIPIQKQKINRMPPALGDFVSATLMNFHPVLQIRSMNIFVEALTERFSLVHGEYIFVNWNRKRIARTVERIDTMQ